MSPARIVVAAAALLAACATTPASDDPETPVQLEPRQIIVAVPLVTPAVRAETARRLAHHYGLERVGAFPLRSIDVHCIVFEVPADRDVDELVRELARHPGVRLVQRNERFIGLGEHSDPYASFQHGAATMRADAVHRWATGRGVRVAVVDTGVDREHPDLAERIVASENFVAGGEDTFVRDAHGTAVAGVIAALADNGEGIYGVAPDAELVVAKACWHVPEPGSPAVCSSWTLARAIDFAIGEDVRVLNLSLAGPPDPLLTRLLGAASEAGIVVTAAAGDGADGPAFPAALDTVIAVVSSDVMGAAPARAWQSGDVALAAPGAEILTTAPGARYRFHSGSSISTAHVSGAVALLLEHDPEMTPAEVARILEASARDGASFRRVDACAALRHATDGVACPH